MEATESHQRAGAGAAGGVRLPLRPPAGPEQGSELSEPWSSCSCRRGVVALSVAEGCFPNAVVLEKNGLILTERLTQEDQVGWRWTGDRNLGVPSRFLHGRF